MLGFAGFVVLTLCYTTCLHRYFSHVRRSLYRMCFLAMMQISILKRLNHRHIVHLREVLASSSKLYLVMDLVNGGELFELVEHKGALNEDFVRRFFHQLVDAISYCHSVGVSHRDLKVRMHVYRRDVFFVHAFSPYALHFRALLRIFRLFSADSDALCASLASS